MLFQATANVIASYLLPMLLICYCQLLVVNVIDMLLPNTSGQCNWYVIANYSLSMLLIWCGRYCKQITVYTTDVIYTDEFCNDCLLTDAKVTAMQEETIM